MDLYTRLAAKSGNFFFSPISVYDCLGLAFAGAANETAAQLAKVLRWSVDRRDTPPSSYIGLNVDNESPIVLANAIWTNRRRSPLQSYRDRLAAAYRAELFELDFARDPGACIQEINRWIEAKTHGKIRNLLGPEAATDKTGLILTNAVYLDAAFAREFDPNATKEADFHLAGGGRVAVSMMHQQSNFSAVEEDRFLMVTLPYSDYRASMQIYLPK